MKISRRARLAAGAALLSAFAVAAYWLPVGRYLQELLEGVRGMGAWGPVLLAIAYVIATVCFIPGSVMTLGAGFLFGVVTGAVTVSLASVMGASAAFWLARTIARGWIEHRFAGDPRFQALDRAIEREGFKIVLLVRLSPVTPFTAINYALGLTSISYRDFLLASWIGMLPGTVLYAYLGSTLHSLAELGRGDALGGTLSQSFFVAGLMATLIATLVVTRIARRALRQASGWDEE
ncbi:MAG TPA: TVP38/TMEM64 family protein [Pirellulales bacterium]|nr:TVP38/TMEM64 family protein [Pirellulales bacterium]